MESSGKPGMVHISEATYSFLEEEYYVQKAEDLEGNGHTDEDILTAVEHWGGNVATNLSWSEATYCPPPPPRYFGRPNLYPKQCATNAS